MPTLRTSKGNRKVALICSAVLLGMVGAAFAAVPLYRAFCQATGYDGTVSRAEAAPLKVLEKNISVRFDTNAHNLPWTFVAEETQQTVRIGATSMAHFKVTNNGKTPITGQALFNVLPETTGAYFKKLECFCFKEQTLKPGETIEFPVVYFVDPKLATDPETRGVPEITLSYTFYPSKNGAIQE
jgi:cytochrome c oxidase assembly protein subunit 11